MYKKASVVLFLSTLLVPQVSFASGVTGIHSLNNEEKALDYKLSDEDYSSMADKVLVNSDSKEVIKSTPETDTTNIIKDKDPEESSSSYLIGDDKFRPITTPISQKEINWLVDNKIVTRPENFTVTRDGVTVEDPGPLYDSNNPLETMSKTDFLVGAYKAIYGPINSRPLLMRVNASRNAGEQHVVCTQTDEDGNCTKTEYQYDDFTFQQVSGTGKTYGYIPYGETEMKAATFPEGDYLMYVSPNVTELYLKALVDKKIVPLSDIADVQFQSDYTSLGTQSNGTRVYPRWYNGLSPFMLGDGRSQYDQGEMYTSGSKVFGRSFDITGVGSNTDRAFDSSATVKKLTTPQDSEYFLFEDLSAIDALKYIESMLRLTEKDMTDTEATIVSYKYGASYLNQLASADRKTVMFLTAKGILDFEDPTEYKNLYGQLTKEFAYKLFYRLANKDARTDFSKIQLTDSDNFWLNKGYSQLELNINTLQDSQNSAYKNSDGTYKFNPVPDVRVQSIQQVANKPSTVKVASFGVTEGKSVFGASDDSGYKIVMVFDSGQKYKFNGTRISDLKEGGRIQSVVKDPNNGKVTVTFLIANAASSAAALAWINSNIQIGTDFLFDTTGIHAVAKFDSNGKQVILVPASIFKDTNELGQKILVMEDKVLKNLETGTTAVLLDDKNIAIVGTHVITSEDMMVTAINGEVYYNLEIIRSLLSNTYLSSLDPNGIYVSSGILNEKLADVYANTGPDNVIGKTYVAQFSAPAEGSDIPSGELSDSTFINVSQLSTASNFLIKNFKVQDSNNQWVSFKMILHFVYQMPDESLNFTNPLYSKSNPNFSDVNSFIYTRPSDAELADWWDNNIAISNAFANVFYGTSGVQYVKSGYLVPNVTILYNSEDKIQRSDVTKVLQEVGAQLPNSWIDRFMGGDYTGYNVPVDPSLGSTYLDPINAGGVYYPQKPLMSGYFPKWVHAMFNNQAEGEHDGSFTGAAQQAQAVSGTTPAKKKANTELWRYMMQNRTLSYQASESGTGGVRLFTGDGETWVVTSGDAVYLKLSDSGDFPAKLYSDNTLLDPTDSLKDKTNLRLEIQSRTDSTNRTSWIGKEVTDPLGMNSFSVQGISGNKLHLIDTIPVVGTPNVAKRGSKDFYEITGVTEYANGNKSSVSQNAIERRYNELTNIFTRDNLTDYVGTMASFADASVVTALPPSDKRMNKPIFVDKGLSTLSTADTRTFSVDGTAETFDQVKGSTVYAYVSFDLDLNLWDIDKDGTLIARKTFPYLQIGNIYFSGINQTIMDSILASYVGTKKVNDLPNGSTVLVGDIAFVKDGDYFVSKPQQNVGVWTSVVADADNETVLKNGVYKAFTGMAVNAGNNLLPLVSFIKNVGLGEPSDPGHTASILGQGRTDGVTKVFKFNGGKLTTEAYSNKNPPAVTSVVFKVQFGNELLARKIDNSSSYQMLFYTNVMSEGYLDDVPFFGEDLKLDSANDLYLLGNKTKFDVLPNAKELSKELIYQYQQMFNNDLKSFLKGVVIYLMEYCLVITWICFALLKMELSKGVLEAIRHPSRDGTKGLDLIKIVSFGTFSLDSRFPLRQVAMLNLAFVAILYVVLRLPS